MGAERMSKEKNPVDFRLQDRWNKVREGAKDRASEILADIARKSEQRRKTRWRCRVCSEEGEIESSTLIRHCGEIVRQLAPVSEESRLWMEKFLNEPGLHFLDYDLTNPSIAHIDHFLVDNNSVSIATQASKELYEVLNCSEKITPSYYELYNHRSDHLRVSDLRKTKKSKKRGIQTAVRTAIKWHQRELPVKPNNSLVTSEIELGIELGNVFDEFFKSLVEQNPTGKWSAGKRVKFHCEELDIIVSGSPDLFYDGIPVEMKTLPDFRISRNKFLPQIAMYSHSCGLDWMLLLLISKTTGEFRIIPVDGKKALQDLRKKWKKWANSGGSLMSDFSIYRILKSNANNADIIEG